MSRSVAMSMSMSLSNKGNGQVKNGYITIISMLFHVFLLIFMPFRMDMVSEGAAARKNYDV